MHVLGILPLLAKIFFARRAHGDVKGKVACALTVIVDVICLVIQLGAVGFSVYLVMQHKGDRSLSDRWTTTNSTVTSDDGFYVRDVQRLLWQVCLYLGFSLNYLWIIGLRLGDKKCVLNLI